MRCSFFCFFLCSQHYTLFSLAINRLPNRFLFVEIWMRVYASLPHVHSHTTLRKHIHFQPHHTKYLECSAWIFAWLFIYCCVYIGFDMHEQFHTNMHETPTNSIHLRLLEISLHQHNPMQIVETLFTRTHLILFCFVFLFAFVVYQIFYAFSFNDHTFSSFWVIHLKFDMKQIAQQFIYWNL